MFKTYKIKKKIKQNKTKNAQEQMASQENSIKHLEERECLSF